MVYLMLSILYHNKKKMVRKIFPIVCYTTFPFPSYLGDSLHGLSIFLLALRPQQTSSSAWVLSEKWVDRFSK